MTARIEPAGFDPSSIALSSVRVKVRLLDLHGKLVRTLLEESHLSAGVHEVQIDGRGKRGEILASGLYCYRAEPTQGTETGRVAILK